MAAANTYVSIASTTLTANQNGLTFSSIPSTYTDLVLVYQAKSVTGTGAFDVYAQFNSDTGTNYSARLITNDNGTTFNYFTSNAPSMLSDFAGSVADGVFNLNIMHFMNYSNTTTYKTVLTRAGRASGTGGGVDMLVGMWRSTAAINTIYLIGNSFATGSTFNLYGIKAA
jgi:hypothetical protein